jgi:hypothetical protein
MILAHLRGAILLILVAPKNFKILPINFTSQLVKIYRFKNWIIKICLSCAKTFFPHFETRTNNSTPYNFITILRIFLHSYITMRLSSSLDSHVLASCNMSVIHHHFLLCAKKFIHSFFFIFKNFSSLRAIFILRIFAAIEEMQLGRNCHVMKCAECTSFEEVSDFMNEREWKIVLMWENEWEKSKIIKNYFSFRNQRFNNQSINASLSNYHFYCNKRCT